MLIFFLITALFLNDFTLAQNNDPEQLVIVIVPEQNANQGELFKFEQTQGKWEQVGPAHAITIGRNGVAWSDSEYAPKGATLKVEGDKRSPAGIFALSQTFGRSTTEEAGQLSMPYEKIGPNAQCIEDRNSAFYNQIVFDNTKVEADWKQDDRMLREDELYDWGVFVEVNEQKVPGKGSCIFIHIWRGSDKPTAGCTAMSKTNLSDLVHWLDATKKPHLVLMPKMDYERLQDELNLPVLP